MNKISKQYGKLLGDNIVTNHNYVTTFEILSFVLERKYTQTAYVVIRAKRAYVTHLGKMSECQTMMHLDGSNHLTLVMTFVTPLNVNTLFRINLCCKGTNVRC